MTDQHPNLAVLQKLDIRDIDGSAELFADDFIWHYFNPKLPEVQGDYAGVEGLKRFFATIAGETRGTFRVEPVSATPIGDELVVVHARDTMTIWNEAVTLDVVVVWRVVDGRIAEGWDIPSVYTQAVEDRGDAPTTS